VKLSKENFDKKHPTKTILEFKFFSTHGRGL